MIRIQKLKQPKKISGKKLEKGESFSLKGISMINNNKFPVYIDFYQRKKPAPKVK